MNSGRSGLPVLSILIPTRNRTQYALPSIRHVLSIPGDDLEVVVQDNSDTDSLWDELAEFRADPRLRYNHSPVRTDVVDNFQRAIALSTGEYLCFIGDDDGVNPEILKAARWAKAQELDALLPSRPAHYWWPDLQFRHYGARFSGSLEIKPFSGKITRPDAEVEMRKCARLAGRSFGDLPRSYYGLIKRTVMDQVFEKAGTYFPGPSPDLAGAMSTANFVKRFSRVDYPLFVPGSSRASTAGLGAMKKHEGRLEEFPHLPRRSVENWSQLVPAFFAGSTIWGEDVVQALKAVGREDILREFNIPFLHAMLIVFNPAHFSETMKNFYRALRVTKRSYFVGTIELMGGYIFAWWLRIRALWSRVRQMAGMSPIVSLANIGDVQQASEALVKYLAHHGRSFEDAVRDGTGRSKAHGPGPG